MQFKTLYACAIEQKKMPTDTTQSHKNRCSEKGVCGNRGGKRLAMVSTNPRTAGACEVWYKVSVAIEGAAGETKCFRSLERANRFALTRHRRLKDNGVQHRVRVTSHYCRFRSGNCECVQWGDDFRSDYRWPFWHDQVVSGKEVSVAEKENPDLGFS